MRGGWVEERLGNVCKLLNGRAYKQKEQGPRWSLAVIIVSLRNGDTHEINYRPKKGPRAPKGLLKKLRDKILQTVRS